MMRRRMLGVGMGIVLGLAGVATAWAWPGSYEGQPPTFHQGADAGFYLWHDDGGNHLATTGPGPQHHYEATITTDGRFTHTAGDTLEDGDRFRIGPDGHMLHVNFTTSDGVDQVDWRDDGGSEMDIDLSMDGQHIDYHNVWIGSEALHPLDARFRLYR